VKPTGATHGTPAHIRRPFIFVGGIAVRQCFVFLAVQHRGEGIEDGRGEVPPLKYNRAEGREAKMTQVEGERGAKVRFPPPLVYLASILLGVAMRYTAGPFAVAAYRYLALTAGVAALLGGLWLIVGAWTLFRRTGQDPKPWKPTPEIVLSGPYRFTRNPMYLGLTCIQIGLGMALNNLWISLLAAFSLLAVHFIAVIPEENYLTEKFGDSYRGYLAKVRRYL
jgi:protein-S-isoprenylcysteine O-methyltransferase Ste14